MARTEAYVSIGCDHDTPTFAVAAIRRWWATMGSPAYPNVKQLFITADAGGSNGYRSRSWKAELQKLTMTRPACTPMSSPCSRRSTMRARRTGSSSARLLVRRRASSCVRLPTSANEALADVGGVNLHAGAAIDGRDRKRLERLCRYIARPPLAQERLEEHGDGRLRYRFKRAWRNGTYAVVLEPLDLVARLVALVPPPRFHRRLCSSKDCAENAAS